MNNKLNHTRKQINKAIEEDKYLKIFKHLESVNLRNKAAFDELLRFTYNSLDGNKNNPDNQQT